MDSNSQRNSEILSGSRSNGQHGPEHRPCAECQILDCHSIHGSVAQECPLKKCYICADLARTNDEISRTYKRLYDLVKKRRKTLAQPRHDTIIRRLPVEILSLIFVYVRDAIIDFRFQKPPAHVLLKPPYKQPSQSPPLLVGAVCKRWRDITLAMPELWTDITIDLIKSEVGQFTMVKEWASRSGALPVDITIDIMTSVPMEEKISRRCEDVLSLVRSLSARWHDISLRSRASFCYRLLNNLQRTPLINSIFLTVTSGDFEEIQLQHLLPRHLVINSFNNSGTMHIPFEWDRLVFFETNEADSGHILDVIGHAQNLKYCIATNDFDSFSFSIPSTPIINDSLVHFATNNDVLRHLTLPSLQHLDIRTSVHLDESINSIVRFIDRSSAPLESFILHCCVYETQTIPRFDNLRGVTSLILYIEGEPDHPNIPLMDDFLLELTQHSPNPILPRLKKITLDVPHMLASSWSSFSRLLQQGTPSNLADTKTISNTSSTPFSRSLSQGCVRLWGDLDMTMDKDTFLRLLEAKNSGVDLTIADWDDVDLFDSIADLHGIDLC